MRRLPGLLLLGLASSLPSTAHAGPPPAGPVGKAAAPAARVATDGEAEQDVIFLGDTRPIFMRLRIRSGDRPFRSAWMDSVRTLHKSLDRDGDGTVTRDEADRGTLGTLVRVATGGETSLSRSEVDNHPKDGVVSLEELADALRTALGPFRVQVGRAASGRTDALFEHLDRDKDGVLTKAELSAASGSLGRLDLDDDELIDTAELEPFANPAAIQVDDMPGRRGRYSAVPTVVELTQGDPSLRPVRLLIKRYDTGKGSAGGDSKLSAGEFGIDSKVFAGADSDGDGALDTEELRGFLARVAPDIEVNVSLPGDAPGAASVEVAGGGRGKALPAGVKVKRLAGGDVEIAVAEVRLEVHAEDGAGAVDDAKRSFNALFEAADTDNNGYLEMTELTKDKDHPSPLASLFGVLDRDGDGKLYPKEVDDFVARQAEAARSRIVLSTADQGRAIFAILDLNRDRRLGPREVRGTVARVSSWDRDGDGRVTADEIPHHYQLTLGRGRIAGFGGSRVAAAGGVMAPSGPEPIAPGPTWFRRMDRNRDGDLSPREFFGPRAAFERLDRDKDGLIDPAEAGTASATAGTK